MPSRIESVATAVPEHRVDPKVALRELSRFWPRLGRLDPGEAGIGTRYVCEPIDQLLKPRGITALQAAYLEHAKRLCLDAAKRALASAGIGGPDVDLVITVSCTGYLVPSLDVHLAAELGLRADVLRLPITELGCSGGAAALGFADRHLRAFPDQKVLVLAVELSSLNFHPADGSLDNLTAALVFGDGAGAAVLGGSSDGAPGLRLMRTASHLVPGTAALLGFDLVDQGFRIVLDRRLPRRLVQELAPVVRGFVDRSGLQELDFVAAHAAGPRIFEAVETALGMPPGGLALSRQVFTEVGNTSSAAIFFILERLVQGLDRKPARGIGLGLGPGVSVELMELSWVPLEDAGDESGPAQKGVTVLGQSVEQPLFSPDPIPQKGRVQA